MGFILNCIHRAPEHGVCRANVLVLGKKTHIHLSGIRRFSPLNGVFALAPRGRSWSGCRRRGQPAPSSGSCSLPAAALRQRRGRAGRAGCRNRRLPRALAKCDLEAVIKGSSLHSSLKVWPSREERSCSIRGTNSWKESSGMGGVRAEISSIAV